MPVAIPFLVGAAGTALGIGTIGQALISAGASLGLAYLARRMTPEPRDNTRVRYGARLSLRMDPHAQYEIRVYADVIGSLVEKWVPLAWEAFRDYRLQGMSLSRMEVLAVKALLRGERPDYAALGLSAREERELRDKLGLLD